MKQNQEVANGYAQLSLKDLLEARDLYHAHLVNHVNVIATAVGRYRVRIGDSWPDQKGPGRKHGTGERTLNNSEVRPYSWPCILVFVEQWVPANAFSDDPSEMVPKTLYLPDGRKVPVCVVRAPQELKTSDEAPSVRYPLNNIGGGFPVLATVQGKEHVATIACLVTDGHKVYGLTNRHVTGEPGEVLCSRIGGKLQRIGITAGPQLTRLPFSDLYPNWPGTDVYVNADIGLIEIDDLNQWTAQVRGIGTIGPMVDLSSGNFSLALVGRHVRAYGCGTSQMFGEISALFYRYKSQSGFEHVADFLIGPRSIAHHAGRADGKKVRKLPAFATHPGDSGTLWLLESKPAQKSPLHKGNGSSGDHDGIEFLPLAVQWGSHTLDWAGANKPQPFALATCLSTVCNRLNVDPLRDWNLDQPDTWGAVGHFSIASRVASALSNRYPGLVELMKANLPILSHDDQTILRSEFKNMGNDAFVPMADVPDFFWKHGRQGASRGSEGPNHFADMDQKRPADGLDLLSLCQDPKNIDPDFWNLFYDSVADLLTGDPITKEHRGLLPFRVWQIFEEVVRFARNGATEEFVCAAGVLTHYIGDACQPLHISYLHDGDPEQPVKRTVHHRDGSVSVVADPLGKGVHSGYEDDMVNANRQKILAGLDKTAKVTPAELINSGFEAAQATIKLMRNTFQQIPPADILQAFLQFGNRSNGRAEFLWKEFGNATIRSMQDGTHLIAVLWESAWKAGEGDTELDPRVTLAEDRAMEICANRDFLPSCTIDQIGAVLKRPGPGRTPEEAPAGSPAMEPVPTR